MKKLSIYKDKIFYLKYLFLSIILNGIYSCTYETEISSITSGELAKISIKVKEESPKEIISKAFAEDVIENMHVLIYNNKGVLISQQYASGSSLTLMSKSGTNCSIYAIANTGNSSLFKGDIATTEDRLKAMLSQPLSSLSDIKVAGDRLIMVGYMSGVNIAGGSNTQVINGLTVKRISSKININVNATKGITITKYRICNIPNRSFIINRPNINENLASDIAAGNDGASAWFNSPDTPVNSSSFSNSFFLYENRRGGRVTPNNGDINNQREKSLFAPQNATYIEVTAKGSSFSSIYRIYLGADNSQNYNIKRNVNYTYNITINGAMTYDTRVSTSITVTPKVVSESNCYMLTPGSAIRIPVSRANTAIPNSIPDITKKWNVSMLWTDNPSGISASGVIENLVADFSNGGIVVKAGSAEGNALIAVKDLSGTILWSWHIWVTNYTPIANWTASNGANSTVYHFNNLFWMDRNIGACSSVRGSNLSMGLIYQWGRKDPMTGGADMSTGATLQLYDSNGKLLIEGVDGILKIDGSATGVPNNLITSIRNPTSFLYAPQSPMDWYCGTSTTQNDNLWGICTASSLNGKTIYDPCPEGWKVPAYDSVITPWNGLTPENFPYDKNLRDRYNSSIGSFPGAGWRYGGAASGFTFRYATRLNSGYYWSGSVEGIQAHHFNFDEDGLLINTSYIRSDAFSVRCVQE